MSFACCPEDALISDKSTDVIVFHAGTSTSNGEILTSGGRVLVVTAYALTLQEAVDAAYAGVDKVSFEGKTYRRDIAHRCAYIPALSRASKI